MPSDALLPLLLIVGGGSAITDDAYDTTLAEAPAGIYSSAYKLGAQIGASYALTTFLCIGGFVASVFALLAWRNGAGLRAEIRHQEMLAVHQNAIPAFMPWGQPSPPLQPINR